MILDLLEEIQESAVFEMPGPRDKTPPPTLSWRANCRRLNWETLGLSDHLPTCMNLWTAKDPVEVFARIGTARSEIEDELWKLHLESEGAVHVESLADLSPGRSPTNNEPT